METAPRESPPRSALRRALYPLYYHGSAANHFLRRRIRPAGMSMLLVGIAVTGIAAGNASDSVFRLLSFTAALGAIALLAVPLRRARLEVARELPPHATAGEPVRLRYRVHNRGRRRLRRAWLIETAPDPRPPREQFFGAVEPGEEKRHPIDRAFSYDCWNWLCERRQAFAGEPAARPLELRAGESGSIATTITPQRRGLIRLEDLRVLLPDPLGLCQRCQRVAGADDTLTVLPRRHRLPPLELPGSARLQPGGDAAARQPGPAGEFVGLRDYRAGDPMRLIHWKSWARTGRPIVKELEDTFFPRHGLLLDTFPEGHDEELFEAAVSIAASFVASLDRRECLIDLMFIAGRERVLSAGRGAGRPESLLEALAAVEAAREPDFTSLRRLVLRHGEDLAGCLAVFAGWSDDRATLLGQLGAAGIASAAITVVRERPASRPPGVHFVALDTLAADLLKLPPQL